MIEKKYDEIYNKISLKYKNDESKLSMTKLQLQRIKFTSAVYNIIIATFYPGYSSLHF